jgi:hypothetical protein
MDSEPNDIQRVLDALDRVAALIAQTTPKRPYEDRMLTPQSARSEIITKRGK